MIVHLQGAKPGKMVDSTEILNSDNGQASAGATMDYSNAFGDFSCLAPGKATELIVWRVKPAKNAKSFVTIEIAVTGTAERSGSAHVKTN